MPQTASPFHRARSACRPIVPSALGPVVLRHGRHGDCLGRVACCVRCRASRDASTAACRGRGGAGSGRATTVDAAIPAALPPTSQGMSLPQVGAMPMQACPPPAPGQVMTGPTMSESGPVGVLPQGELSRRSTAADQPRDCATAVERPAAADCGGASTRGDCRRQAQKANVLWLPNLDVECSTFGTRAGCKTPTATCWSTAATRSLPVAVSIAGGNGGRRLRALAARQVLAARRIDTQTARNEALEITAESYFTVQMSRGTYSSMIDATNKAEDVVRRVSSLGGLVAPDEIDRARMLLAELEQSSQVARQQWRVSSANLHARAAARPGRGDRAARPDHLQVTLIEPTWGVDDLIVVGLMNRPELASNRAIVQANVIRLRRERMRPLMPQFLVTGNGTPDFYFQGGIFGTGTNGSLNQWAGRGDIVRRRCGNSTTSASAIRPKYANSVAKPSWRTSSCSTCRITSRPKWHKPRPTSIPRRCASCRPRRA